jgi:5-methylcytosine-specific restriction protein A
MTATHVDHIVPFHLGGRDEPANLQSLCADHHAVKSGREGGAASAAKRSSTKIPREDHPGLIN